MSAGRCRAGVAVAVVAVIVAGCATGAPGDGSRAGSRHGAAWTAPVDWPFSLGVAGDDAVVTVSRNRVVALDTGRGHERWRADVAHVTHYEPALDARTVLVCADDRFVALERSTGSLRWEAPVAEHAGGAALARAGSEPIALVTTERGQVAALDGESGEARWSAQLPGDIYAAPAVDSGAGVAAVLWRGDEDRLRVLDLATGATRWEIALDPGATAPLIHRGQVVVGEGSGNFEARAVGRDLTTGAERWSVPVPASFESGVVPGADGDDVAMSDHFGTVTLVDATRGTTRWQTSIREPILDTRVLVTANAVVLATYGGKIVVLDRVSGRIVRRVDPAGFPVGIGLSRGRLIFAVRLARPDRVEAERLP